LRNDIQINPARWAHERLVRSIINFEKELDDEHEIGARLVNFSPTEPVHIDDLGYWGPDFVIFHGTNLDGRPVELIQHISQVNVLLVALKKEKPEPRRIGFELEKKLEEAKAETPDEDEA
tara:strand:+ start:3972 stop:4331 length:360 start_codon:yes stop_codon:yes gene_type:complete